MLKILGNCFLFKGGCTLDYSTRQVQNSFEMLKVCTRVKFSEFSSDKAVFSITVDLHQERFHADTLVLKDTNRVPMVL